MIDYVEIDNRIQIRNAEDLLKTNKVVYVNKFSEASFRAFREDFIEAHQTGQEIIPIIIDSFGGGVYSLLGMVDIIEASEKKVATIVVGKAMSCGAVLLTCGDEGLRFAAPTSTIMIHDVSMGTEGKIEDVKTDAKEGERINKIIFSMMETNCGLKKGEMMKILRKENNSTDWYLTPHQARKLNMVNHIRLPRMVTEVTVTSELT